jgi:hypothetical protein
MDTHHVLLLAENIDAMAIWLSDLHWIEKPYSITLAPLDLTIDDNVASYDLIIIQAGASTMSDAVETLTQLYAAMTKAPLLFISSVDDEEYIVKVYEAGADEYIIIPIGPLLFHVKLEAWLQWRVPVQSRSLSQFNTTRRLCKRPIETEIILSYSDVAFTSPILMRPPLITDNDKPISSAVCLSYMQMARPSTSRPLASYFPCTKIR